MSTGEEEENGAGMLDVPTTTQQRKHNSNFEESLTLQRRVETDRNYKRWPFCMFTTLQYRS